MANRGIAVAYNTDLNDVNVVDVTVSYTGFQHGTEDAALHVLLGPSAISAATFKAAVRDALVEWYSQNPSEEYDEWDDTPITGDNFVLIGGIL